MESSLDQLAAAIESDHRTFPVTASKSSPREEVVLSLPMRTDGPKFMAPVRGSTTYDNFGCSQVYETLVQYKYLGPLELEPLLLAEIPKQLKSGLVYRFKLKNGGHIQDDPCFPNGKGR